MDTMRCVLTLLALAACGDAPSTRTTTDTTTDTTADVAPEIVDALDVVDAPDTTPVERPGFHVVAGELRDARGAPFIMRGVNNPHIWWDATAFAALDAIAEAGANTVRVVWETRGAPERLGEILARVVALGMVPVVEVHDVTGSDDPKALAGVVAWWTRADVVNVLDDFRREAIVNIANEWGGNALDATTWRDAYVDAVGRLRAAGLGHTIMIDGAGWGQSLDGALAHGAEVLAADPDGNVVFSVHMYARWNDPEAIGPAFAAARAAGLALVVGEFGWDYNEGLNNLFCRVDAPRLLAEADTAGVGWLAWSWFGNNADNAWLDLTTDGTLDALTDWGQLVVDGERGLLATARAATIYTSPGRSRAPR